MSSPKRVLIVARHFWPTTNDATLRLVHWVGQLRTAGAQVTILTSRANSDWPKKIFCGESPVFRIEAPVTNKLHRGRYCRQLADWVAREANRFDVLYCDECDLEAATLLEQIPPSRRPPLVVRFDHSSLCRGNIHDWRPTPKIVEVCQQASAVIATCAAAQQCLIAAGISNTPILRMQETSAANYDRSIGARRLARELLSQANHDLFTKSTDRVIVCPGDLSDEWSVDYVIAELGGLVEKYRNLHLWILGDGPDRNKLGDVLRYQGLQHSIKMPGVFTDLENVFQVADLCLFPAAGQGLSWLAPTCAASNIPMLLLNTADTRSRFQGFESNLFDRAQPHALKHKVDSWLRDAKPLVQATMQIQKRYLDQRSSSATNGSDRILALFDDCCFSN